MARQGVLVILAVIVVGLLVTVFVVSTQMSAGYTNKVGCVDSVTTIIAASTFTNGSMAFETVTTVSSFTTTTNASATTGHVTTERLGPFATGLTWEVTTQRTCTFGK
jgi:hypothetical protein